MLKTAKLNLCFAVVIISSLFPAYTLAATFKGLGWLDPDVGPALGSVAYAVSSDGSVIVGASGSETGIEAFRWQDNDMNGLGYLFLEAIS